MALALRLLFLLSSPDRAWPHSAYYEGDAPLWATWAAALDRGEPFEFNLPIHSPGVAYFLHWLGASHPGDFLPVKVLWCLISAATCGMAYVALVQSFGRPAAGVATAMLTFSFGQYVLASSLNNETPYLLVLLVAILVGGRLICRPGIGVGIAVGVFHALAALLRPEHTLLVMLLLVAALWRILRSLPRREQVRVKPWRRSIVALATAMAAFAVVCAPWSIAGMRAAARYNRSVDSKPAYDFAAVPWTPDAREFLDALPPFLRGQNFVYCTDLARQAGAAEIDAAYVRNFFEREFGYVPEPLTTWTFVSSQGPLSFALANHPEADGGFSKVALENQFHPDPRINFALPSHLKLYNHGYSVGWSWIADDPGRWVRLVAAKLSNFAEGVALGFTAHNVPYGRDGVRRAVDLATPARDRAMAFKVAAAVLLLGGFVIAARRRRGGAVWLVVIGYKLIVTILFFGYARQAVSIAPAFYAFMAMPIALAWEWCDERFPSSKRWVAGGVGLMVILAVACDLHAAFTRTAPEVHGPARPAPNWAPNAFEANMRIELHHTTD